MLAVDQDSTYKCMNSLQSCFGRLTESGVKVKSLDFHVDYIRLFCFKRLNKKGENYD